MAVRPDLVKLNGTSVDVINTIRANSSGYYQEMVPEATGSTDSIRAIGNILSQYPALQNEFLNALVNRIGRVILTSRLYENPWASFKKGLLEMGETVEEIFVNIAKPFQFDQEQAVTDLYKREIPDVRSAFHILNYQKFYKVTISRQELRQAFLSWTGVTDLIGRIVDSLYTGANYDEFLTMKYLLAVTIVKGNVTPVTIDTVSAATMKPIVSTIKGESNLMEFMSSERNIAGVQTYTPKRDQFVILNAKFQAQMDVEVLAAAFNMDKAEFMGHLVMVDDFAALDKARLQLLLGDNAGFYDFSEEELTLLSQIPAVIVSRDWFMIFDNLFEFTEEHNGQGLYWNYFYHTWKIFSVSPFAEAVAFLPFANTVTAVTITPATVTLTAVGQHATLTAAVTGTGIVSQKVTWVSSNPDVVTVDSNGLITVKSTSADTVTITATSVVDTTKSGTATITVPVT